MTIRRPDYRGQNGRHVLKRDNTCFIIMGLRFYFDYMVYIRWYTDLVEETRFIRWHHILDIDECIWSAVALKRLQGLLDQVTYVFAFLLRVINPIATVEIHILENVQNR